MSDSQDVLMSCASDSDDSDDDESLDDITFPSNDENHGEQFNTIPAVGVSSEVDMLLSDSNSGSHPTGEGPPIPPTNDASSAQASIGGAEVEKRRQIQIIMKDKSLSDLERRLRIQQLMDGRAVVAVVTSTSAHQSKSSAEDVVICPHYERKCSIIAPCCGKAFGCRVCHDELTTHGPMDRFAVKEIVCKECLTKQGTSNCCVHCGIVFGEYHCQTCNLWMALAKKPFHCPDCGFCRVGGRDAFTHCHRCFMCISSTVFSSHNCMKDKYKNNCPVCREDMFSSRQSPQDLPCGHAIHGHCFRKLAGFDYRCPICKKTVVSQASMAAAWSARARDIAMQPMPPDLARVVNIMCNDCEVKSPERDWHFLGVQCPTCNSFNTVVEQVVRSASREPDDNMVADG